MDDFARSAARQTALAQAVANTSPDTDADRIVADAEKFAAFLERAFATSTG